MVRAIAEILRSRLFWKTILATVVIGAILNAVVLAFFYQYRADVRRGEVAAEIAAIANRIARPASAAVGDGDVGAAREFLGIFAGLPFVICADLSVPAEPDQTAAPVVSWPVPGCDRIKKPGLRIDLPLPALGDGGSLRVRLDDRMLADTLNTEILVIVGLGFLGGLALVLAMAGAFHLFIQRPLLVLGGAIEDFEIHNRPTKASYTANDEIGRVGQGYNEMLDREVQRVSEVKSAHKSIVDSVSYATRIQGGLLPTEGQLSKPFADVAVLWKPRDGVSGDVYWTRTEGGVTWVALIDCTGHGVPGGFMTMVAVATLERIFASEGDQSPAEALAKLSDLTRALLSQDTAEARSNDGMDAVILQIDGATHQAVFAGARNSLLLKRNGTVRRIRGDKRSLGYIESTPGFVFAETTLSLNAGDEVLLTTDGVIDQLGGARNVSLGFPRLMSFFESTPANGSKAFIDALDRRLATWSANRRQYDDIAAIHFVI